MDSFSGSVALCIIGVEDISLQIILYLLQEISVGVSVRYRPSARHIHGLKVATSVIL